MKTKRKLTIVPALLIAAVLALWGSGAEGASVSFNFKIPSIPWPPLITDVTNSAGGGADATFVVAASIAAQLQQTPACDKNNQGDCTSSDWYLKPSPGVTPNPPAIKMAKVYYRLNDGAVAWVSMSPAPELGENKWKADVPIDPAATKDDIITYYIVAVDSRGNVASQTPDTGSLSATCPPSPSSWFENLSTPKTDSCTHATSYTQCNVLQNGSPSCGSNYTMNDKGGDVCGEPDGSGNQSVVNVPKLDITGMSVAADKDYLCANIGLGAAPPDSNDVSPIEGYLLIIFNPDKYDDNPADFQIKNAYAITYAPEVQATDPTLVRVLWDANCVTDPNTANILDCKLIYVTGTDKKLQVGYNSGLKFIVKKSGTGDPLPVSYSLIGDIRKLSYIVGLTGEINLSGSNPFWISDLTAGLSFYNKNQQVSICGPECGEMLVPPVITSAIPTSTGCDVSFSDSTTPGIARYQVYRETSTSFTGNAIGTVTDTNATSYTYHDVMQGSMLNGNTYYYFASSMKNNVYSDPSSNKPCTVPDTYAPAAPVISKAATPAGGDGVCGIEFSMPAEDSSLRNFIVYRDGAAVNQDNPVSAVAGKLQYSFTDSQQLAYNISHSYKVKAVDGAGNSTESGAASCSPEDLKAPAPPVFIVVNQPGKLGIHIDVTRPADADYAGFNVYGCRINNATSDCKTAGAFTRISGGTPLGADTTSFEYSDAGFFPSEGSYAFYVESVDNCDSAGTCPSLGAGNPNASGFPASLQVLSVSSQIPPNKPAFPAAPAAFAPPEGRKCKITWSKNYKNSDGTAFSDPVNPSPSDIVGYKIMRGAPGAVPAPNEAAAVGVVGLGTLEFVDTSVVNKASYGYVVYALNAFASFSENGAGGAKAEVVCNPKRIIPPATPTMQIPVEYSNISCSPSWGAVEYAVSYNVYRCDGVRSSCNAANKFTLDADCAPGAATTCTNNSSLATDNAYTFCVTALDEDGNESGVYPNGQQLNCGECTPSARPKPVTAVNASTQNNVDTKIYWTNSESINENGTSASGVNIYRCGDAGCATKTVVKSCSQLTADSAAVRDIGAGNPLTLGGEPSGEWYYAVTFQTDCADAETESFHTGGTAIGGPVNITGGCVSTDECVVISSCSAADLDDPAKTLDCGLRVVTVSSYQNAMDGNNVSVPVQKDPARSAYKSGVDIYLVKEDGAIAAGPVKTDSRGNFTFMVDLTAKPLDLAKKYLLIMKIPAAERSGIPCTKPGDLGQSVSAEFGGDCGNIFAKGLTLKKGVANAIRVKFPFFLPGPGQGRSEVGNFDCDSVVGLKDFNILKTNMKLGKVSSGAAKYSDINQDGFVNLTDFNLFKQSFGKQLDSAPAYVQNLCKP